MKVLTLTQPWASLVAIGAKRLETRSWQTKYRGPLAIHAAKGFPASAWALIHQEPFRAALSAFDPPSGWGNIDPVPTGVIIAVVDLLDVIPTGNLGYGEYLSEPERSFGDYSPGRYAWVMVNPRLIATPIACKGALGLWETPEGLVLP